MEFAGGCYEGQIVDGEPHGEGKWTMPGGGVLEGTWYMGGKQNKRLIDYDNLPPGFVLTGKQVDGVPVVRGKYDWGNGTTYEGEYLNGFKHGYGKYTGING